MLYNLNAYFIQNFKTYVCEPLKRKEFNAECLVQKVTLNAKYLIKWTLEPKKLVYK